MALSPRDHTAKEGKFGISRRPLADGEEIAVNSMRDVNYFQDRRRVARRLRELRVALGMTQAELSKRMGFAHPSSISSIEHGRRPIYREELPVLAAALKCTVSDLLPATRELSSGYPVPRAHAVS